MNLPNFLTMCRFALIPVYLLIFAYDIQLAFIILVIAGVTDILDGYLARSRGQVTQIGGMLDPLADKSMMIVAILSLLYSGLIPWEAAAAVFIRDVGMIVGGAFTHFRGKKTVPANVMGKITTVLYYSAILMIVLHISFATSYLWFVILFSFVTSMVYIFQFKLLNQKAKRKFG